MLGIAIKMLMGDRAKYIGLVLGVAFTAFLGTFAASYACGIATRGFALISENRAVDVWVMDGAVASAEQTVAISDGALDRVRGVEGVRWAVPMCIAGADLRFPDGGFQPIEIVGIDDATMVGLPAGSDSAELLRAPDAAFAAAGGTEGKLQTPSRPEDQWKAGRELPPRAASTAEIPRRELTAGDEVLVNDHLVRIAGRAAALPRFPPRPLLYMTYANALRILPAERHRLTFVLVSAKPGVDPRVLAKRISTATGLTARSSGDFEVDTVKWFLTTSEDVGDMTAMLAIAVLVGLGSTGVLLLMFTRDNLRYYALLAAMGTTPRRLVGMVFAQVGTSALAGIGIGLGACALAGMLAGSLNFPFRMMWFTPLIGAGLVIVTTLLGALASLRPLFKVEIGTVFAGR